MYGEQGLHMYTSRGGVEGGPGIVPKLNPMLHPTSGAGVPGGGAGGPFSPMTVFSSVSSLATPMIHQTPGPLGPSGPSGPSGPLGPSGLGSGSPGLVSMVGTSPPNSAGASSGSSISGGSGGGGGDRTLGSPSSSGSPVRGDNSSISSDSSSNSSGDLSNQTSKQQKSKGVPYIPSYMDLTNGPEPCVVCSDAATGYHYRCMTCEGCKGFFRRTIQKNLQYHCKWNRNCIIDKTTRNQCQECRFIKCLQVGMATDLVLNERQRTAKRKLIQDNRERRRKDEQIKVKPRDSSDADSLTDQDRGLICEIVTAYEYTSGKIQNSSNMEIEGVSGDLGSQDPESCHQLAEAMTPSIVKVVEFAKGVPGFTELNVDDQILLLKSCCMEIMCLRAACRFDPDAETLTLHNGLKLHKSQIHQDKIAVLIEPIFDFAMGLSKLKLDKSETALLAAVLLMQSDRSGLSDPASVERLQDAILAAFKHYVAENRPHQPVHWAKILMKVTDLRTISTRHAERVLCIRLDNSGEIPPLLLEVFNEGHSIS